MTPTEIETKARRLLNAVGSKFWSSAEIIEDYIYAAALELAQESYCIENRYQTTSVASQEEYSCPSYKIAIKRVEYIQSTSRYKLKNIDHRQFDSLSFNTDTAATGIPQYYVEFDEIIKVYPTPNTSGDTIKILTYDIPQPIIATNILQIPTRYHQYLVQGVAYHMSLKELGHPNTSRFEGLWQLGIQRARKLEKRRRRGDSFRIVLREEDTPSSFLGQL